MELGERGSSHFYLLFSLCLHGGEVVGPEVMPSDAPTFELVRPSTLVILYLLLQNRIFLLVSNMLSFISTSSTFIILYISPLSQPPTRGAHLSFTSSFYPPRQPLPPTPTPSLSPPPRRTTSSPPPPPLRRRRGAPCKRWRS
jgi:hypothetical protein